MKLHCNRVNVYPRRSSFKGIIFIVGDALRYDSFKKALTLGFTPTLMKLYRKGIIFENAYSVTNTTDPSITTILSGLHPLNHGIVNHGNRVTRSEKIRGFSLLTLPEIFRENGYFTYCIDFLERWHLKGFNVYASRLQRFRNKILSKIYKVIYLVHNEGFRIIPQEILRMIARNNYLSPIGQNLLWQNATFISDLAINYIKHALRRQNKFMAFIHYWCTHSPYFAPSMFLEQVKRFEHKIIPKEVTNEPLEMILKKVKDTRWRRYLSRWFYFMKLNDVSDVILTYYASLMFLDNEIKRLLKFLEDEGLVDDVLIIFTSDHGESLGEHKIYFDHHGLYEVSLRIPLILYSGRLRKRVINKTVLHTDLAPTILDFVGLRHTNLNFDGISLFPIIHWDRELPERPIIAVETWTEKKISIKYGEWKLILSLSHKDAVCRYCGIIHGGITELYNIRKDPKELNNIAKEEPKIVRELKRKFFKDVLKFKLINLRYSRM